MPYILEMLHDGRTEMSTYISGEKEFIVIDDDVIAVLGIMDEIIEYEETEWRKKIYLGIRSGYNDIPIMVDSPLGRTKYYEEKRKFIDTIYQCCIYKHMVDYKDILGTKAG